MNDLPIHAPDVPVYDCHVLISGPDASGLFTGVVTTLPEIQGTARNERDLLRKLTADFKARIKQYRENNQDIPWQPRQQPEGEQQQRWIPVHL